MTQTTVSAWSERLQQQLMAALDAAWEIIDTSTDPAEIRRAREKARACGEIAANVRKIVAVTGLKPRPAAVEPATPLSPVATQADHARRALEKLKGGGRARL